MSFQYSVEVDVEAVEGGSSILYESYISCSPLFSPKVKLITSPVHSQLGLVREGVAPVQWTNLESYNKYATRKTKGERQKTKDERRKRKDKRQKTKDEIQKMKDKRQNTKDKRQKTKYRSIEALGTI